MVSTKYRPRSTRSARVCAAENDGRITTPISNPHNCATCPIIERTPFSLVPRSIDHPTERVRDLRESRDPSNVRHERRLEASEACWKASARWRGWAAAPSTCKTCAHLCATLTLGTSTTSYPRRRYHLDTPP